MMSVMFTDESSLSVFFFTTLHPLLNSPRLISAHSNQQHRLLDHRMLHYPNNILLVSVWQA